jgi:hypothetical protein
LFGNAICSGVYLSDLEHLKTKFNHQYFTNIPSPDTIECACQELKTKTIVAQTFDVIPHDFNYNNKINNTLVALCVKTGQLKTNEKHTLDFDNVVLENDNHDAKKSYKKTKAYPPRKPH